MCINVFEVCMYMFIYTCMNMYMYLRKMCTSHTQHSMTLCNNMRPPGSIYMYRQWAIDSTRCLYVHVYVNMKRVCTHTCTQLCIQPIYMYIHVYYTCPLVHAHYTPCLERQGSGLYSTRTVPVLTILFVCAQ